jgi:Holliday junction DNA helicase RuvA
MIGRIAGIVVLKAEDHVLIDVRGVGYEVYCAAPTLAGLPPAGEAAALWTDMVVREDLMQLFGFATLAEREWHRLLTSVQGVGAKASLSILGALGADGIGRAIALGDWGSVKAARGIGPKTAQRVVNELKDKAPAVMAMGGGPAPVALADVVETGVPPAQPSVAPAPAPAPAAQADALSALANLGYAPADAARAVAEAQGAAPDADTPALIRAALRRLAPPG